MSSLLSDAEDKIERFWSLEEFVWIRIEIRVFRNNSILF